MATVQPGEIGAHDGNLVYEERPDWFSGGKTPLLAFEDKNNDARIQYYNDVNPDFAETAQSYGWKVTN